MHKEDHSEEDNPPNVPLRSTTPGMSRMTSRCCSYRRSSLKRLRLEHSKLQKTKQDTKLHIIKATLLGGFTRCHVQFLADGCRVAAS